MNTPWPDDVLDCAKRLAKSLGYEDDHVMAIDGVVEVYRHADSIPFSEGYDNWYWFELDPRDPTVWSALIGGENNKIYAVEYKSWSHFYCAQYLDINTPNPKYVHKTSIGLAVCEAYNILKGNIKCTTSK